MKKFVRQLLLGIGGYHALFAILIGIFALMLTPANSDMFSMSRILYAYGMTTAIFGGLFIGIAILFGIVFCIMCLINKVSPIQRSQQIDAEEESKEYMEQLMLKWRAEFRQLHKDDWDEFVKEKMKNADVV